MKEFTLDEIKEIVKNSDFGKSNNILTFDYINQIGDFMDEERQEKFEKTQDLYTETMYNIRHGKGSYQRKKLEEKREEVLKNRRKLLKNIKK